MARGAHYGPTPPDAELPRKRRRVEDSYDSYRPARTVDSDRSRRPDQSTDSYRPAHQKGSVPLNSKRSFAQPRKDNMNGARDLPHKNSESSAEREAQQTNSALTKQPSDEGEDTARQDEVPAKNQKSKKARKANRSSRIHSLRKQLDRGGLPPTIKRERERELASLVFEQEKRKLQDDRKKNLERYHFVRFIERQKATREIKKLTNLKNNMGKKKSDPDLDRKLREAEIDLAYTQYAPLGEKYISLYATKETHSSRVGAAKENLVFLDNNQRKVLQAIDTDPSKAVIRTSGNIAEDGTSLKPPRWYDVEAAMKQGKSKLEALRDGKAAPSQSIVLGLRSKTVKVGDKRNADWLDDDGVIHPADLDSDSEEDDQDGGVNLANANANKDEDEDMSDGDGGFFERT